MVLTKWISQRTSKFISLYREAECLWNPNIVSYRDKAARELALGQIIVKMGISHLTANDVKKKIKILRSTYMIERKKMEEPRPRTNCPYQTTLSWFYEMDSFIKDLKKNPQSTEISQAIKEEYEEPPSLEPTHTISEDEETEGHNDSISQAIKDEYEELSFTEQIQNTELGDMEIEEQSASVSRTSNDEANLSIKRNIAVDSATRATNDAGPSRKRSRAVSRSLRRPLPKRTRMNKVDSMANNMQSKLKSPNNQKELDEFEVFGKHVGTQLKSMQEEDAVTAQEKIQSILTFYRLKTIRNRNQLKQISPTTPDPILPETVHASWCSDSLSD